MRKHLLRTALAAVLFILPAAAYADYVTVTVHNGSEDDVVGMYVRDMVTRELSGNLINGRIRPGGSKRVTFYVSGCHYVRIELDDPWNVPTKKNFPNACDLNGLVIE